MAEILLLLKEFPAVGILGPRQVGKTTLAVEISKSISPEPVYMDLENPNDQVRLSEPEQYFEINTGKLIILDEIQHTPGLFRILRSVIDKRRREGYKTKQFLILGSASLELLKQSSESLAGRVAFKELSGLTVSEIKSTEGDILWLRGGFPDSYLAKDDKSSLRWRYNFITTYLEREIPQLGPRIPAATLRRLWTMLAHSQGSLLNIAKLGASLDVAAPTAKRYLDLLEDLFLIRMLRPWSANTGKRLVRSPKVYIRDSGITHALLVLVTLNDVLGHPVAGASWEGFAIENILSSLPTGATPWFYRTSAGAEIDLVIEQGIRKRWAIEIKRSTVPVLSKGFHIGCSDIKATEKFIVYPGKERFPVSNDVTVMPLRDMLKELQRLR
ncbi:ATP-binding protein [Oscillatoria amoena NRMC-F 0135]|nr:ATP-binding protein [Oscillatoria amoena NRMC-F 0135]